MTALCTSYPELASMFRPFLRNTLRIAALGDAFMAYRTVRPNALGNASAFVACSSRRARS